MDHRNDTAARLYIAHEDTGQGNTLSGFSRSRSWSARSGGPAGRQSSPMEPFVRENECSEPSEYPTAQVGVVRLATGS